MIRIVRIADIVEQLPADEVIAALAMAMEELAIAQALVIVHGQEHGARRYVEAGGHVRFDAEGEPCLLWRSEYAERSSAVHS